MILKDLRISPLRNILTSISMLVGIIAMIGSVLVGTLGKEYLISVNAQIYGWVPTYSFSIMDCRFEDAAKMQNFLTKVQQLDDSIAVTLSMQENISFAPIPSLSSLKDKNDTLYKDFIPVDVIFTTTGYNKVYNLPMSSGNWFYSLYGSK